MQVFLALSMAAIGVSHTSTLTSDSSKAKSAISSIFAIIDRKSRIDPSDDTGVTLEPLSGDIEFQHVRFRYPTRPDVQIFQDLCLTIQSGKVLNIHPNTSKFTLLYLVPTYQQAAYKFLKLNLTNCLHYVTYLSECCSGKSIAIALLRRFYDPDAGHILLDRVDIQKFQLRWLSQQLYVKNHLCSITRSRQTSPTEKGRESDRLRCCGCCTTGKCSQVHPFIASGNASIVLTLLHAAY